MERQQYRYCGPVMLFDRCVQDNYENTTYAVSEKKAKSNLTFAWKMRNNLVPSSRVTLPGKVELVS